MSTLPERSKTMSEDDYTSGEDTSETTKLFQQRLQAWKHACEYLEDYVEKTEKMQQVHAKEYEKVLKTVNHPLKEGDHFSQNLGGMAEMFDNIRSNTQGISNGHAETAKVLKNTVLPIFSRLETEIKHKEKELKKGVGKGSKNVDKARAATQKHIELLSQHTAAFDSVSGGKIDPSTDPYVLQKGVRHRLNKQILEENMTRQDVLGVQDSFSQFESHVVQQFQVGMGQFYQAVSQQSDQQKRQYANMVETSQRQNPMFEWNEFLKRNNNILIDPSVPARTLQTATFANQDHAATQALCQGALERKQGLLKKFDSGFYAITPSKFLHEFKTDDDIAKDPTPDFSLYLPDCQVGGLNGTAFSVKGKDASSKLGLSGSKEIEFRARTAEDAETWWRVIRAAVSDEPGSAAVSPRSESSPVSLRGKRTLSGFNQIPTSPSQDRSLAGAAEKDFAAGNPTGANGQGSVMENKF